MPSVTFRPGEITYLMGHNGSGKSVFLQLLTGERESDTGAVPMNGARDGVSIVRQDATQSLALDLTVRENILLRVAPRSLRGLLMPRRTYENTVTRVLEPHAELLRKVDDLALHLSGGQRQTLALLAATVRDTRILLLDEFLAATDLRTGTALQQLVRTYANEKHACAVIVSHDVSSALAYGDRILLLRQGILVADFRRGDEHWNREAIAELIAR